MAKMGKQSANKGFNIPKIDQDALAITGNNYLLAIGIDKYQHCGKLSNAVRDAKAFSELMLEKYQFEPAYLTTLWNEDATHRKIKAAFRELVNKVNSEDNLIVYFSGHGHYDKQYEEGYWVPVEAKYEAEVDYISYSYLLKVIKALKARHVLFIVDSCYSGAALVREKDITAECLYQDPSRWLLASGRNEVVPDGIAGGHSPFAEQLLDIFHRYSKDQIRISTLVEKITTSVTYNSKQTPIGRPIFGVGDKGGEFVFIPKQDGKSEEVDWSDTTSTATIIAYNQYLDKYENGIYVDEAFRLLEELEHKKKWESALIRNTTYGFRIFIRNYPESPFKPEAQKKLRELLVQEKDISTPIEKVEPTPPKPKPKQTEKKQSQPKVSEKPQKHSDLDLPPMITVEGGTFKMAKNYQVTLSTYEIAQYPVTQKLWQQIMGDNPSGFNNNEQLPVEKVSWEDCQIFIKKLNNKTGENFKLPTEAEWEYAARGGNLSKRYRYAGSNNLDEVGWYKDNSLQNEKGRLVGEKNPNELGIYDMSGNVWEWCQDWFDNYPSGIVKDPEGSNKSSDYSRVVRGGSWKDSQDACLNNNRRSLPPSYRHFDVGFRLARTVNF